MGMNYEAAEKFVFELLEQKLSKNLFYHNLAHTQDVLECVQRLGASEKVSGHEMMLLKTAALFHDTGFMDRYEDNESLACKLVSEALPGFGYAEKDIEIINGIIMSTALSATVNNLLHEIIRDADLDYLGRDDFARISSNYRKELHMHGTSYTDKEWYQNEIRFLENHSYFTLSAKADRDRGKQKNLEVVKKIFRLGQY
jgi:predicted metal-dependent HD superfamily phosphohydrolase